MSLFGNLGLNIFDGVTAQAQGAATNWLKNKLGNGFKGSGGVRFYYDKNMGGGIINVVTKSILSTALKTLTDEALKQYHNLLFKGKVQDGSNSTNMVKIISEGNEVDDSFVLPTAKDAPGKFYSTGKYGVMTVNNGQNTIVATDMYGERCVDAFMMGIPVKSGIEVRQQVRVDYATGTLKPYGENAFTSDTLVWWDCTAIITIQSQKNLIVTKVNGRDYSRKELVSNGDINISISGTMSSDLPEVYPTLEIQKFIRMMKYKGPIRVNSQYLSQFGIDRIIIQDFNMPQKRGFKNLQEYTINAIGLQPDKETLEIKDTIKTIDTAIMQQEKEKSPWAKILDDRLDGLKRASEDVLSSGLSMASGMLEKSL